MPIRPRPIELDTPPLLPTEGSVNVCMVLLSGVGDVVHGLPLALDVKRRNPSAFLTWVAEPAPAEILRHHAAVDRVIVFDTGSGWRGVQRLHREMAGRRADLTLNLQRYFKSVWPTLFSRAPVRIGLPPWMTRDGVRYVNTHAIPGGSWKHTQDVFLDVRPALGVDRNAPVEWNICFSDSERADQRAFFDHLGDRRVVTLVVASANPKKDWPAPRYAELADILDSEFGVQVILAGGPSERERGIASQIASRTASTLIDALGDSVRRLMWMIDGSDVVVAPDTGPLHIAHALNVPVVGLFGHTNPWRVGPWRRFHHLVLDQYTDSDDLPDPAAYAPKDGRMGAIHVVDVVERVSAALRLV